MGKLVDLTGQRFGRLVVVSRDAEAQKDKSAYWRCDCDCGNTVVVRGSSLRSGHTKSCGCLHNELSSQRVTAKNLSHGLSGTRLYGIWNDMKRRCRNEKRFAFDRYGGRGISVCKDWETFERFYEWAMLNGYRDDLTIERNDNDGDYCPENCSWETRKTQGNNKSNNVRYLYLGEEYTVPQLSDLCGISAHTIYARIRNYGWPVEKAVNTPVRRLTRGNRAV